MGGFLHNYEILCKQKHLGVSGPSRGIGGFLRVVLNRKCFLNFCFRPLARYRWVSTFERFTDTSFVHFMFPAPSEGWMVSYITITLTLI